MERILMGIYSSFDFVRNFWFVFNFKISNDVFKVVSMRFISY